MKPLVDQYVKWLSERITFTQIEDWFEVVTPFLNHQNDNIELYIKKINDKYIITDGGATINELELSGVQIDRGKRRLDELSTILNGFGVKREGDELITYTSEKNFPEAKHRLIQAILAVDDLFVLAEPKVKSIFIEDVQNFFDAHDIRYISDVMYAGRSGFTHKFEFSLPRYKNKPETLIKTLNTPRQDTIGTVLWAFEDTKKNRKDTAGIVIINDTKEFDETIYEAFSQYDINFINWSQRDSYLSKLVG